MDDVEGLMLLSFDGETIFRWFSSPSSGTFEKGELWDHFIASLSGIREAELVFERKRLYIRKTEMGYLVILIGGFAPTAMVRLNCDILLPSLKQMKRPKGLKRLFKRRK